MKKSSANHPTDPQESEPDTSAPSPETEPILPRRGPVSSRETSDPDGIQFRKKLHLLRSLRLAEEASGNVYLDECGEGYRDEYDLIAALMVTLADHVNLPKKLIDQFDQAWKELIQPVIHSGSTFPNPNQNWRAFALVIRYLQDEGIWLPVCSKPWIAALRLLLALPSATPPDRRASRTLAPPRKWPFPTPIANAGSLRVAQEAVRWFLPTIENITSSSLREAFLCKASVECPRVFGVVPCLERAITRWDRAVFPERNHPTLQSTILSGLIKAELADQNSVAIGYEEARASSLLRQYNLLVDAITAKRGDLASIDELSAHFARPRPTVSPLTRALPSLFTATPQFPVFPVQFQFSGRLKSADWLISNQAPLAPPDSVKLWIARNWVNPDWPLWLMQRPAIIELLRFLNIGEAFQFEESWVREATRHDLKALHPAPVKSVVMTSPGGFPRGCPQNDHVISYDCFREIRVTQTLRSAIRRFEYCGPYQDIFTSE